LLYEAYVYKLFHIYGKTQILKRATGFKKSGRKKEFKRNKRWPSKRWSSGKIHLEKNQRKRLGKEETLTCKKPRSKGLYLASL